MSWDVVVIGAGAAGLIAAWRTAERGRRTILLEKNSKAGVKILMSGGTRCNVTHHTDRRGIVQAFGDSGKFLHSALAAWGPDQVVAFFAESGVPTKIEETGKVFPVSDRALDVQRALLRRCQVAGVELRLNQPVQELRREAEQFAVVTPTETLVAPRLIVTTGGQSYPGCGTVGDGYRWMAQFGHTIVPPVPALVPLKSSAHWIRDLAGLTLPDTQVEVWDHGPAVGAGPASQASQASSSANSAPRLLARKRGSFLFTHVGMSGPVVMDVSRVVSQAEPGSKLVLRCDFLPSVKAEQTQNDLRSAAAAEGRRPVLNVLSQRLPRRLLEEALYQGKVPLDRRMADLSKAEGRAIVQFLHQAEIPISGTLGFGKAEVTAGGVSLREVHSQSMESKLIPGLYLAGEILDLDGPIGGFNFQAAFSTGYLAGSQV